MITFIFFELCFFRTVSVTTTSVSLELLIQIGILGCLLVLVYKAYQIEDNLNSLMKNVGTGLDKIK